jgi:CheY-like chemotaxis protein
MGGKRVSWSCRALTSYFPFEALMKDATVPTVVIIGEAPEFVYLMQRYVSQGGYHTCVMRPNTVTLDAVRQEGPICILVDVESPRAKGWDVLRMLKADLDTRHIPVVICSWLDEEARCLEEGATAHMRKPVMYDDVLSILAEAGLSMEPE